MKQNKKSKGAEAFGVKIKVSKSLDRFSGKLLFPEKLEKANRVVNNLR